MFPDASVAHIKRLLKKSSLDIDYFHCFRSYVIV